MTPEKIADLVGIERQTYGTDPRSGEVWYCAVPHADVIEAIGKIASLRAAIARAEQELAEARAMAGRLEGHLQSVLYGIGDGDWIRQMMPNVRAAYEYLAALAAAPPPPGGESGANPGAGDELREAAIAWVAADRERPSSIMDLKWMAGAEAEREARHRLHDAVDALTDVPATEGEGEEAQT